MAPPPLNRPPRFAKHAAVSSWVKDTVEGWGLKLLPVSREAAAHTMTAVFLPEGMTLPQACTLTPLQRGGGGGMRVSV